MPIAQRNAANNTAFKRFRIRPLQYNNAESGVHDIFFNSIITEFSDTWTPRWSSTVAYGRMDPMPFYSGTGRELTFGFRVISDDANEAKQNMVKIQNLIKYQYPSTDVYQFFRSSDGRPAGRPFSIMKAPPYFEFEFLNLFNSFGTNTLRGYINGGLQIQPGFQSKEQAQYFNSDFSEIYFSDVSITLRISVVHDPDLFFGERPTINGQNLASQTDTARYPYGVSADEASAINGNLLNNDGTPVDQTRLAGSPPGSGAAPGTTPGSNNTRTNNAGGSSGGGSNNGGTGGTGGGSNINNAQDLADVSQALDQAIQGDTTSFYESENTTQSENSRNLNERLRQIDQGRRNDNLLNTDLGEAEMIRGRRRQQGP